MKALNRKVIKSEKGFSIVELTIVVLIMSVLIIPFYNVLGKVMQLDLEEDRTYLIRSGLAEYYRIYGTFPCPSPLNATLADANYVVADCTIAPVSGSGGGKVLIGAPPIETLRQAMDCSDRPVAAGLPDDMVGVFRRSISSVKDIIGGAIPTDESNNKLDKTRCLRRNHLVDTHGSKFLYAVTESATQSKIINLNGGQIEIIDSGGNEITAKKQIFVVISHGPDHKGGFSKDGIALAPACGGGSAPDDENCNNNYKFRSMLYSEAAGSYFDDFVDYSLTGLMREDSFWEWQDNGAPNKRDLSFNQYGRAIIGEGTIPDIQADEILVVKNGNMVIDQSLMIESDGGSGGNIEAGTTITSEDTIGARISVIAPKYCYSDPC